MKANEVDTIFKEASKELNLQELFEEVDAGSRALWATTIEMLLLLAPLALVGFTIFIQNKTLISSLLNHSDISLLATFIFIQATIKMIQFPQDTFVLKGNEVIVGIVAIIFILGVLPSAITFTQALISVNKPVFIQWLQPILLAASVVTYLLVAFISNCANIIKTDGSKIIVAKAVNKHNKSIV